jgi:hypothetical protein
MFVEINVYMCVLKFVCVYIYVCTKRKNGIKKGNILKRGAWCDKPKSVTHPIFLCMGNISKSLRKALTFYLYSSR